MDISRVLIYIIILAGLLVLFSYLLGIRLSDIQLTLTGVAIAIGVGLFLVSYVLPKRTFKEITAEKARERTIKWWTKFTKGQEIINPYEESQSDVWEDEERKVRYYAFLFKRKMNDFFIRFIYNSKTGDILWDEFPSWDRQINLFHGFTPFMIYLRKLSRPYHRKDGPLVSVRTTGFGEGMVQGKKDDK